jgi:hypothetical protein
LRTSHTSGGDGRHHEIPTTHPRRDTAPAHRERLRRGLFHLDTERRGTGGSVHDLLDVHDLVHVHVHDRYDGGQAGASAQAGDAQAAGRPPHHGDGDDSHDRAGSCTAAGDDDHDDDSHEPAPTTAHDDHAHDATAASADHHAAHDDHEAFGIRLYSAGRRRRR